MVTRIRALRSSCSTRTNRRGMAGLERTQDRGAVVAPALNDSPVDEAVNGRGRQCDRAVCRWEVVQLTGVDACGGYARRNPPAERDPD